MESATAARLLDLNRQFYQTFGRDFSATRGRIQPGVRRVLGGLQGDEAILDLGCGNGELARALASHGHHAAYIGLDFSRPLLKEAERQLQGLPSTFLPADLTSGDWDSLLVSRSFDLVFAFAVLHHIPGLDLRLSILHKVRALLCEGGKFIHSEWQFLNSLRLQERIQDWGQIGLAAADVDRNDYLLDWRHGGRGLRYVHHFDAAELNALAADSGFRIRATFHADGQGGRLGLYQIWEKKEAGGGC